MQFYLKAGTHLARDWYSISAVAHEADETKNEEETELQINVAGMEMHSSRTCDSFEWKLRCGKSRGKSIL